MNRRQIQEEKAREPQTPREYIEQMLDYQVGEGCRYKDMEVFAAVLGKTSTYYQEPDLPAKLDNIDNLKLSDRQMRILGALLGMTEDEYKKFTGLWYVGKYVSAVSPEDRKKRVFNLAQAIRYVDEEIRASRQTPKQESAGTPIKDYLDEMARARTGEEKRFKNQPHYERALREVATRYQEPLQDFESPDRHSLSLRQVSILSALLGLNDDEFKQFRDFVDKKHGLQQPDTSLPMAPRAGITPEVEAIIAATANAIDVPVTTPKAVQPSPTSPARERKPRTPKAKGDKTPLSLDNAFSGDFSGATLLADTRQRKLNIGEVLEESRERLIKRCGRNVSQKEFAETIGITAAQYGKFARNEHNKPPVALMDSVAEALGAKTQEEKIEWRKLILSIPAHRNQRALNLCFDIKTIMMEPDGTGGERKVHRVTITPEETGSGRGDEVYKFFKLLADRHGLADFGQLTAAIIPEPMPDGTSYTHLQKAILQVMSGHMGRLNPDSMSEAINKVAEFAFPGEELAAQRSQCIEFLSDKKYLAIAAPDYVAPQAKQFGGFKTPQDKTGQELLDYAYENKLSFGGLLSQIHDLSGGNQETFCQEAGVTPNQYRTWVGGSAPQAFNIADINALTEKLGAKTNDEKAEWRKFMFGIDRNINQSMLNRCFTERSSASFVDIEATDWTRKIALSRFFSVLEKRHGLTSIKDLSDAIATSANLGQHASNTLEAAIRSLMGGRSYVGLDPNNPEHAEGVKLEPYTISEEKAQAIATFTFPEDEGRAAMAKDFLSSPKYRPDPNIAQQKRVEAAREAMRLKKEDGPQVG